MNFLQKIFGKNNNREVQSNKRRTWNLNEDTVVQIQANATKLWAMLEETVEYYQSISCQCAFPRFIQYASHECGDMGGVYYMSETEGFIDKVKKHFDIEKLENGNDGYEAIYTCRKCRSTYLYGYSEYSIAVSRQFLKPQEIKAIQVGANPITPVPFTVGLFGHQYPDQELFQFYDFDSFKNYLGEMHDIA